MRTIVVVGLVAACGHKGGDAPAPAPANQAPRPELELVSCGPAPAAYSGDEGWGTIGTTGHGAGPRSHDPRVPSISIGRPNAVGDLDKAIIRRYIRRDLQRFRYCYEKELVGNGSLQGTVQTQFYITPEGKVAAAAATGVDPKVADCVAGVIKSIEFPKPKGGGGVQVNYPFTFRPADPSAYGTASPPPPTPALPDPALARQQAIQQARAAGILAPMPNPIAQWTPFARMHRDATMDAPAIDREVGETVRGKLADVDRCFGTSATTGTLRAMIDLGAPPAVRVGGLGDMAIETCVAGVLRGATYSATTAPHEIECELARGGDSTVRATLAGGYAVVGATKAGVVVDGMPIAADKLEDMVTPKDRVALVVVESDAPTPVVRDALRVANTAPATLVAVHTTGTPVIVGVTPAPSAAVASTLELWGGGVLRGCANATMLDGQPPFSDPKALADTLAGWSKSACGRSACDLRVAIDSFGPDDLVALAAAARSANLGLLGLAGQHECR